MAAQTIPASKLLNDFLKKSIVPELNKHGFAGKGRVLTRAKGDGIQVIDIQNWKYNDPQQASFTVEMGVCFPQVLAQVAQLNELSYYRPYVNKPDIVVCQARQRIGMLLDEPQDIWWAVTAATGTLPDPAHILVPLTERGLPWLAARSTYSGLVESGEAGGGAQAAVILALSGRHEAATAEADAYAQRIQVRNPEAAMVLRVQLLQIIAAVDKHQA